jgi:hypothetical protein
MGTAAQAEQDEAITKNHGGDTDSRTLRHAWGDGERCVVGIEWESRVEESRRR